MLIPASTNAFFAIATRDSAVSYRLDASSIRAVPFSNSALPISIALDRTPVAEERRRSASDSRMPVMPSSVSTALVDMPICSVCERPSTKAVSASAGRVSHIVANCSADMPDTCANSSRDSPPSSTALPMRFIVVDMAVPPASASMPTDDIAAAMPRISPSESCACAPAPARRIDMSTISDSVVAKLLPRPTTEAPRRPTSCWLVWVMFMNRASAVAAWSADMFVDSPRSIIVRVNPRTFGVAMPSWPAASATAAIS